MTLEELKQLKELILNLPIAECFSSWRSENEESLDKAIKGYIDNLEINLQGGVSNKVGYHQLMSCLENIKKENLASVDDEEIDPSEREQGFDPEERMQLESIFKKLDKLFNLGLNQIELASFKNKHSFTSFENQVDEHLRKNYLTQLAANKPKIMSDFHEVFSTEYKKLLQEVEKGNDLTSINSCFTQLSPPFYRFVNAYLKENPPIKRSDEFEKIVYEAWLDFQMSILNKPEAEKLELLLIVDEKDMELLDENLLAVIKMRQHKKGPNLVILSYKMFEEILKLIESHSILKFEKITKLSFLHHWNEREVVEEKEQTRYYRKLKSMVLAMPNLKEIILRGCSASFPAMQEQKVPLLTVKVIEPTKNIREIQGDFIIQQEALTSHKLKTTAKYKKGDELVIRELENMPDIYGPNRKLSVEAEKKLQKLVVQGELPPLNLLTVEAHRKELTDTFFKSPKTPMSKEERQEVKKNIYRARTLNETSFPGASTSLAHIVKKELDAVGYKGYIKAYIKAYRGGVERAIPELDHDQDKSAKAIRVSKGGP